MENYNAYSKNANVTFSLFTLQSICWISLLVFDEKDETLNKTSWITWNSCQENYKLNE